MKVSKNFKVMLFIIILAGLFIGFVGLYKKFESISTTYVSVYFVANERTEYMFSIDRQVKKGDNHLRIAITELLKGPSPEEKKTGLFTEIPDKTVLLGIQENPNDVVINLSQDFEANGGSQSMKLRLKQLSYTTLDIVKDKPVYLELDGKMVEYIGGEGIEIPQPLSR